MRSYYYWLICLSIGIFFALYYNGTQPIEGGKVLESLDGDRLQHMIGANYYLESDWHWPLFEIPDLHYPEGTSLIYTDGIPIVGLAFKLLYSVTGLHYNYISLWVSLCFVFNALGMGLLLKYLKIDSILLSLAAIIFSCNLYIVIEREQHASLCSQFLLILSIWAHLRIRSMPLVKGTLLYSGIIIFALLTHVYLWAMVMALYLAWPIDLLLRKKAPIHKVLLQFLSICSVCLIAMFTFGHLSFAAGLPPGSGGYEFFSMNMLSPVWPTQSLFFPNLRTLDATGGQYEGWSYLGLGLLLFIALTALTTAKKAPALIKNNIGLTLIITALIIYALSDRIYFNYKMLLGYHLPFTDSLYAHFRVAGRFIWPAIYLTLIASTYLYSKKFSHKKWMCAIPLILSLIQPIEFFRSSSLHADTPVDTHKIERNQIYESFLSYYDEIHFVPYYGCKDYSHNRDLLTKSYLASKHNIRLNTAYLARPVRGCDIDLRAIYDALTSDRKALVIVYKTYPDLAQIRTLLAGFTSYEDSNAYYYAQTHPIASPIYDYLYPADTLTSDYLSLNSRYNLGNSTSEEKHAVFPFRGFSGPESWGTWTEKAHASLHIALDPDITDKHLLLSLRSWVYVNKLHPTLTANILVNGEPREPLHFTWPLPNSIAESIIDIGIPTGNTITIDFLFQDLVSPKTLGLSEDNRLLGLGIHSIELLQTPSHQPTD